MRCCWMVAGFAATLEGGVELVSTPGGSSPGTLRQALVHSTAFWRPSRLAGVALGPCWAQVAPTNVLGCAGARTPGLPEMASDEPAGLYMSLDDLIQEGREKSSAGRGSAGRGR